MSEGADLGAPWEEMASRLLEEHGEDSVKRFVNCIVRGKEFEEFVTKPQALVRPVAKDGAAQWESSLPVAVLSKEQAGKASRVLVIKQSIAFKQRKSRAGAIAKGRFCAGDYANIQGVLEKIEFIYEGSRNEGWGSEGGKNYFLAWENENRRNVLVTFYSLSSDPAKLKKILKRLKNRKR